jgi:hypothetical protein
MRLAFSAAKAQALKKKKSLRLIYRSVAAPTSRRKAERRNSAFHFSEQPLECRRTRRRSAHHALTLKERAVAGRLSVPTEEE